MEPIKLRRVYTWKTVEVTNAFSIDPEPFRNLVINTPFFGETYEEFITYIHMIEDHEAYCEELDAMGYEELADNLDMLFESADTYEAQAEMSDSWYEESDF